jgi:hypothetical protein
MLWYYFFEKQIWRAKNSVSEIGFIFFRWFIYSSQCNVAGSVPPAPSLEPCSERIRHGSDPWSELQKSESLLLDFESSLWGAKPRSLPSWERCTLKRASKIQKLVFGFRKLALGVASLMLPERLPIAPRALHVGARELPRKKKYSFYFWVGLECGVWLGESEEGIKDVFPLSFPHCFNNIQQQLSQYMLGQGAFGTNHAVRDWGNLSSLVWWNIYGGGTPQLQRLATQVLSQVVNVNIMVAAGGIYLYMWTWRE